MPEDAVVAQFLAARTEESFCELFHVFAPRVLRYFRVRGCDDSAAHDLTQEVMLLVFCRVDGLRDRSLFRAWLFKIARNVLLKHLRKSEHDVETLDLSGERGRPPAFWARARGSSPGFEATEWMSCLIPQERQVMMLRYIEELEYHEIAESLGIPVGTVKSRLFLAKKKMAELLGRRPA